MLQARLMQYLALDLGRQRPRLLHPSLRRRSRRTTRLTRLDRERGSYLVPRQDCMVPPFLQHDCNLASLRCSPFPSGEGPDATVLANLLVFFSALAAGAQGWGANGQGRPKTPGFACVGHFVYPSTRSLRQKPVVRVTQHETGSREHEGHVGEDGGTSASAKLRSFSRCVLAEQGSQRSFGVFPLSSTETVSKPARDRNRNGMGNPVQSG